MIYNKKEVIIRPIALRVMYSDSIQSNYPKGNVIDIRVDYVKELDHPYIITYIIEKDN